MKVLFNPLPEPKSRWKLFLTSWSVQTFALLFAINIPLLFPTRFVLPDRYVITTLVPFEPAVPHAPQPINPRLIPKLPKLNTEVPVVTKTDLPPLPQPKKRRAEVAAPEVKTVARLPELPAGQKVPKIVAVNTFSTGSSVMPTTGRPASQVQTGGFGDPNGVPARETNGRAVNINAFGSWDLPGGPGYGNGTGGAHGVPGVVASAGFGNGVAIGSPKGGGGGGGAVRQAGFSDSRPPADPTPKKTVANEPPTNPVEILFKPKPNYTAEGRTLKIEGEVKLEVQFTATGQVHVIRVLQGLGHGLDEQAIRAAQQIKFKPAQRQGQAVDSSATLHIIFQLA